MKEEKEIVNIKNLDTVEENDNFILPPGEELIPEDNTFIEGNLSVKEEDNNLKEENSNLKKEDNISNEEIKEEVKEETSKKELDNIANEEEDINCHCAKPASCTVCNRRIPFCANIVVPSNITIDTCKTPNVEFDTSCLRCINEEVSLISTNIINPCDKCHPFKNVPVSAYAVRAFGCINFNVSIKGTNKNNKTVSYFGQHGSVCVNSLICMQLNELDCTANFFNGTCIEGLTISGPVQVVCPNQNIYVVSGEFVLPECSKASIVIKHIDPNLLCSTKETSTIKGTVYDVKGKPASNVSVNLLTSVGTITPNPATTDSNGNFTVTFKPPSSVFGPTIANITALATISGLIISTRFSIFINPV